MKTVRNKLETFDVFLFGSNVHLKSSYCIGRLYLLHIEKKDEGRALREALGKNQGLIGVAVLRKKVASGKHS
jgi:hypothetical protein